MNDDFNKDWYTYLSEDFKLDRKAYRTKDYVVVDCPKCDTTQTIRINHLKSKIKRLGYYECSRCRKSKSLVKARKCFKQKHGVTNPYQLDNVKDNLKSKFKQKYGVSTVLKLECNHKKGIEAAKIKRDRERDYEIDFSQISCTSVENKSQWFKEYHQLRRDNDPQYLPRRLIYSALKRLVQNKNISKTSILKDLDYTLLEFRQHIESLFEPGMTWENHGDWHLDHVKPLSLFDCTSVEEIKKANALENLQPLWAGDNLKKSNKY